MVEHYVVAGFGQWLRKISGGVAESQQERSEKVERKDTGSESQLTTRLERIVEGDRVGSFKDLGSRSTVPFDR